MSNYKKLLKHLILLSLLFWAVFFSSHNALASGVLKCLGAEELMLHKQKSTGPVYKLNQEFINEFSSWGRINIDQKKLLDICESKSFPPSVNLLRHFLLDRKNIFTLEKSNQENKALLALQRSLINSFIAKVPKFLFQYLSNLQSLTNDPKCLSQQVPEIAFYMNKFKYLEEEIGGENLINDKDKIKEIFKKIRRFDKIIKECE